MSISDERQFMGTAEEAKATLAEKAREYRQYRQPRIATAKEHKNAEAMEREAQLRLSDAALLWLWHEENPEPSK